MGAPQEQQVIIVGRLDAQAKAVDSDLVQAGHICRGDGPWICLQADLGQVLEIESGPQLIQQLA